MGPHFISASEKKSQILKRTIKYISVCHDPRLQTAILRSAPDTVFKAIANAIHNVANNSDIELSPYQKRLIRKKQKLFSQIVSSKIKIPQKRKIIQSGGGFFLATLLPLVLSTALSTLGSHFFSK